MNHFFWLDEGIVTAMHEDQLAQHGGLSGISWLPHPSGNKFPV